MARAVDVVRSRRPPSNLPGAVGNSLRRPSPSLEPCHHAFARATCCEIAVGGQLRCGLCLLLQQFDDGARLPASSPFVESSAS